MSNEEFDKLKEQIKADFRYFLIPWIDKMIADGLTTEQGEERINDYVEKLANEATEKALAKEQEQRRKELRTMYLTVFRSIIKELADEE